MTGPGWLTPAASPTFALMAIVTAVQDGGPDTMLCGALRSGSPIGGMTVMYALMSVFHAAPWLKGLEARARCR